MNTNRLVVPDGMWAEARAHLLQDDHKEHLSFFLVGRASSDTGERLLAHSLVNIADSDLDTSSHELGLSLKTGPLLDVMNRGRANRLNLVEAHSHPFSKSRVRFSAVDIRGQSDLSLYLDDVHQGAPHGAIVLGEESVDGLLWRNGESEPIDEIVVVGEALSRLKTTSTRHNGRTTDRIERRHQRQVLAFGERGQRDLRKLNIGVVGAGGTGSVVIQQLAHLGVNSLVIVDPDRVEETNLNRLVCAVRKDIGRPKTEVISDRVRQIDPALSVTAVADNVREILAIRKLRECDVLFGCVDSDSGRLILNELALAYLIPYIDIGVGIESKDGRVVEAGGRLIVWTPGRPCLLCANEIDVRVAAEELETEDQRAFRRKHGYGLGSDVPAPAVISLNSTLSSLAVTSLLGFVTGISRPRFYTYYDMLEHRVGPRTVRANAKCVGCLNAALGDQANLSRYSTAVPKIGR